MDADILSATFVLAGTVFTGLLVYLGARSKNQGEAIDKTSQSVVTLSARVTELASSHATLERKITALEDENRDLKRSNEELKKSNAELNNKVEELEQSKYALAQKMSEMQAELDMKNSVIIDLQSQINKLTTTARPSCRQMGQA